jgi:hypothetical protein
MKTKSLAIIQINTPCTIWVPIILMPQVTQTDQMSRYVQFFSQTQIVLGNQFLTEKQMPVEECGNMLIMTLAYAQRTNDVAYLKQHYQKLLQWTSFLVNDSLIPAAQLSTDDFAGTLQNQTNLALKGIIGIGAMGEIARLTGNTDDANNLTAISKSYIAQWQELGINYNASTPHTTLAYGQFASHGLLYNLWCDLELGLGLVPQEVYDMQSEFYLTQEMQYGVPLDTRHSYTKGTSPVRTFCYILTR